MKSKTRPYFFHLLRQYRAFVLLYFVIALLASPVSLLLRFFAAYNSEFAYSYGAYFDLAQIGLAAVMVGFSILTPFVVFSFLFNKPNLDTYFSLPIKREKLFLKHFAFGWLLQAVPVTVSHLLGFVIIRVTVPLLSAAQAPENYKLSAFLLTTLMLLMGSLFLMMPSMLAILFTPNLFNAIIYAGVLQILPVVLSYVRDTYFMSYYGFTMLREKPDTPLIIFQAKYVEAFSEPNKIKDPLYIVFMLIAGIALLFLSMWLFKNRKAERTNSNDMVKGFYPFMITFFGILILLTVLGSSYYDIFGSEKWYFQTGFVLLFFMGFALYLAVQMIRRHGMPHIGKTIVSYLIIFVVSVLLSVGVKNLVYYTNESRLPKPDQVARVELATGSMIGTSDAVQNGGEHLKLGYYYPFGSGSAIYQKELTNADEIKEVLSLHQDLCAEIEDPGFFKAGHRGDVYKFYHNPNIRIVYYDKNERMLMARAYALEDKEQQKEAEKLLGREVLDYEYFVDYEAEMAEAVPESAVPAEP